MSAPEDKIETGPRPARVASGQKRRRAEHSGGDSGEAKGAAKEDPTPITAEGEMPQKKFYRSRAHCNPLAHNDAFDYPAHPDLMDWTRDHYPEHPSLPTNPTEEDRASVVPGVLDVGCGFGGLTVALSDLLPDRTVLGLEIRAKVTEYVRLRIAACRRDHPSRYRNASVMRTNSMKFMPNYFRKASVEKLFFCFPDPHFKRRNHPRRIVSARLLSEYAHFLRPGGRLYAITDVEELHCWHLDKCGSHPLFRELTEDEMQADPCVEAMKVETEEGKKVERSGGKKHYAVWERVPDDDPSVPVVTAENFWDEGEFSVVVPEKEGQKEEKEAGIDA